ncbi:multiple epidermal growth factor-like domains protein 10 [Mercenaria mercenaria]|uniref:multiple epidermal growth factor-like domains protein 10 n=1 Tax=Mercenaria mercenaria TaxID=6596 RepID=UPI00234EC645|nr:multiple epidermal growth factor-like domains protein 10 [Mercenaria mercenaria]
MKNVFLLASFLATSLISTLASESKRVNVALNQKAHQSSTVFYKYYNWKADFALDGNAEFSDVCRCCSCTSGSETPWLIIDLGSIYHIGKIVVIGRPDVGYQLREFELYAGETERQTNETTSLVYRNAVTESEYRDTKGRFDIAVGSVSMQFIRIYNENIKKMSICEVNVYEACEDYQFEPDCIPCFCEGHPCDKKTGTCFTDCQPGWHGTSCNISCESGKYGTNCAGECRCLNSPACDKRTGACRDGYCLFGWKGKYCNISVIVSEGKSVKMSTQFDIWKAESAVDGNTRTDASACDCCAATKHTYSPWFQIDLGKLFRIAYIVIFGRTDHHVSYQNFKGLNIYATKHDRSTEEPIFSFSKTKYFLNITLKTPVITRYITLKQTGRKLMVICELQLLEGDCDDGQFGRLCDKSCNCLGEICNKETGVCPSGKCLPGYWGSTCSEECADGQFGIGCNATCGHCLNGKTCDKVNGSCLSCNPGYQGQTCTASCSDGTYGLNCSSYCENCQENECDHVTGQCVHGCNPGYSGLICNTSCGYGSYGMNCSQSCGSCANNQTCNNTNGHCDTGCLEGFIEPLCITRNGLNNFQPF